jgi:hypothetical protein
MPFNLVKRNVVPIAAGLLLSPFIVASLPILIDAGSALQDRLTPVVTDWVVTTSEIEGPDLILSGTMVKNRDCIYLPPTLARDSAGVNRRVEIMNPTGPTTWAKDDQPQVWGPWRVPEGAGKSLAFINVYLCGTGRPTIIELGTYP